MYRFVVNLEFARKARLMGAIFKKVGYRSLKNPAPRQPFARWSAEANARFRFHPLPRAKIHPSYRPLTAIIGAFGPMTRGMRNKRHSGRFSLELRKKALKRRVKAAWRDDFLREFGKIARQRIFRVSVNDLACILGARTRYGAFLRLQSPARSIPDFLHGCRKLCPPP